MSAQLYEVAYIYPRVEATPADLIALGHALKLWISGEPSITEIYGLEELLAGNFPPEECYIGCDNEESRAAPPWTKCPAILRTSDIRVESGRIRETLTRDLPAELHRHICGPPFD